MRICLLSVTALTFSSLSFQVNADQHINQLANLIDSQFRSFAENIGSSQSHKALAGSDNSGISALNVGVELATAKVERHSFLEEYTSKDSPNTLYMPKFHVTTQQDDGWNAGAFYSSVPSSDIEIYGGELSYLMTSRHEYVPSLSVRGTYSQLTGYSDLSMTSTGVELSVSKGFSGLTPYAGVGTTRIDGEYQLDGYSSSLTHNKYFMGLQFNLGLFSLSAEAEQTDEEATTRAKMGYKF